MNPVGTLKLIALGQFTMAFILLQDTSINTAIGGITAFGTFANLVVLVGLIYRIGRYTGTTDQTIDGMKGSIAEMKESDKKIISTQESHSLALVKLETTSGNMQADIRIVRDRQHEFANILSRFTAQPVPLRPIERERDTRASYGPADQQG